jgi:hypothetical protein
VTVWVEENLVELFVRCPSDVSGGCRGDVSLALGPRISPGGPRTLETRRLAGRPDALISLYYKVRLLRPQPLRPRFRVTVRTRDRRGVVHPVTRTLWAFVETPDSE